MFTFVNDTNGFVSRKKGHLQPLVQVILTESENKYTEYLTLKDDLDKSKAITSSITKLTQRPIAVSRKGIVLYIEY